MTDIRNWSTDPELNKRATPFGWPEGQAPATINDCARQMQSETRSWYEDAQWLDLGDLATYIDDDSFSVPNDRTSVYEVGRRVKVSHGSESTPEAPYVCGVITSSAYAASITTIEITRDAGEPVLEADTARVAVSQASVTDSAFSPAARAGVGQGLAVSADQELEVAVNTLTDRSAAAKPNAAASFVIVHDGTNGTHMRELDDIQLGRRGATDLLIQPGTNPNQGIAVTAAEAVLADSTGAKISVRNVSFTVNTSVSGAGGLDTGPLGNAWHYIYIISDRTNVIGLLSTSATAPNMPAGYNYRLNVGGILVNASLNLVPIEQREEHVSPYQYKQIAGTPLVTGVWNAIDMSTHIPSTARSVTIAIGSQSPTMGVAPYANGVGGRYWQGSTTGGTPTDFGGALPVNRSHWQTFRVNLPVLPQIYYWVTNATSDIYVTGWGF